MAVVTDAVPFCATARSHIMLSLIKAKEGVIWEGESTGNCRINVTVHLHETSFKQRQKFTFPKICGIFVPRAVSETDEGCREPHKQHTMARYTGVSLSACARSIVMDAHVSDVVVVVRRCSGGKRGL